MGEATLVNEVYLKIKRSTAEVLNLDEERITIDSRFLEDLGAESLDIITLVMQLEDEFHEKIANEDIETLKSVRAVVDYIVEKISKKESN